MPRGDHLGEGKPSPADNKYAAGGGTQVKKPPEGAIVLEDGLHPPVPEIGRGLVDASAAQDAHAGAIAPDGIHERRAAHGANDVRVEQPNADGRAESRDGGDRRRDEPRAPPSPHATPVPRDASRP